MMSRQRPRGKDTNRGDDCTMELPVSWYNVKATGHVAKLRRDLSV
jgi:hypothetical protein